ncbi:hypothetical protein A2U01_0118597, partial [Trifolium medium]|nr:hypothetical protein [Trifolium medium]
YALSATSRYQSSPGDAHWVAVIRLYCDVGSPPALSILSVLSAYK